MRVLVAVGVIALALVSSGCGSEGKLEAAGNAKLGISELVGHWSDVNGDPTTGSYQFMNIVKDDECNAKLRSLRAVEENPYVTYTGPCFVNGDMLVIDTKRVRSKHPSLVSVTQVRMQVKSFEGGILTVQVDWGDGPQDMIRFRRNAS